MLKKILIWGTGDKAKVLLDNCVKAEILGFIQTSRTNDTFREKTIFEPSELPKEYDYIIVANTYSDQIFDICKKHEIEINTVVFLYKGYKTTFNSSMDLIQILGHINYNLYLKEYRQFSKSFFYDDIVKYQEMNKRSNFDIDESKLWPIITDKYAKAGNIHNYFWQDLWAAKKIISSGVKQHFDIGSRLDGFIAHLLSAGISVTMIDIREFPQEIDGLNTIVDDATMLSQFENNSIDSLSALCSLEHFGLGRYGDPVDPEACFKCFSCIQKKLSPGGDLYISVPIGKERVEFNAHRVFFPQTIIDCFSDLQLVEFSATADGLIENSPRVHQYDNDDKNGEHRYGLFHFTKTI